MKLIGLKIVPNLVSGIEGVYETSFTTIIDSKNYNLIYYIEISVLKHNSNNTKDYNFNIIKDIEKYITGEDKSFIKTYVFYNCESFYSMIGKDINSLRD